MLQFALTGKSYIRGGTHTCTRPRRPCTCCAFERVVTQTARSHTRTKSLQVHQACFQRLWGRDACNQNVCGCVWGSGKVEGGGLKPCLGFLEGRDFLISHYFYWLLRLSKFDVRRSKVIGWRKSCIARGAESDLAVALTSQSRPIPSRRSSLQRLCCPPLRN